MLSTARSAICRNALLARTTVKSSARGPLRREIGSCIKDSGLCVGGIGRAVVRIEILRRQSGIAGATSWNPNPDTSSNPKPKRPLYIRAPISLVLTVLTFSLGVGMGAAPLMIDFATRPTDEETLKLFTPSTDEVGAIEKEIWSHPLTQSLLEDEKYIPSRPHLKIPEKLRPTNLTGGTLLGPDKIAVPPLQFTTRDGSTYVSIQYLGPGLCGHPGIVHGGLLATLLDEGLARCCFPALPNEVAVTASLKIDYKAPVMAGQIVVLKAETTKVLGRKAWVKGRIQTLVDESKGEKPVVLTEGEALFIEPKQAAAMKGRVN